MLMGLVMLGTVSTASAQEADPAKTMQSPWPLDQRCAIMAAHLYSQTGFPDQCVGGMWPGKIIVEPQRSVFPEAQRSQIHRPSRETHRGDGTENRPRL